MAGTRKLYIECYDIPEDAENQALCAEIDAIFAQYNEWEEIEMEQAWYADLIMTAFYRSASKKDDAAIETLTAQLLTTYLQAAKLRAVLSQEAQEEKVAGLEAYCNGLVTEGGISTDVFKDALGAEETLRFFERVFFGTGLVG